MHYLLDLLTVGTFLAAGLFNLNRASNKKSESKDLGFLKISGWWMLILALTIAFFKIGLPFLVSIGVLK